MAGEHITETQVGGHSQNRGTGFRCCPPCWPASAVHGRCSLGTAHAPEIQVHLYLQGTSNLHYRSLETF